MARGAFITFEGPEGSGKTTQVRRLETRLCGWGRTVVVLREPGGTPTGEVIRNILQHDLAGEPIGRRAETLLFAASRAHLVERVIVPALAAGKVVLSDRFADSTTAYQGYGRGQDVEAVLAVNGFAVDGAWPDRTVLLDIDVGEGFRRMDRRNRGAKVQRDRMESESASFHERVRQGYLALAGRWPKRFCVVRAGGREEADIEAEVWEKVRDVIE